MASNRAVPEPRTTAPEPIVVPQAAIEAGATRVFVTSPRLFAFSHRPLASLRHPYLPVALAQVDVDLAKAKRQWQTRAEKLTDMLTPTSTNMQFEEERWRHVGFMLDIVMFEAQITARRAALLESANVRRAIETLWCRVGGRGDRGISKQQYQAWHTALYERLVGTSDHALTQLFANAVDVDWNCDRDGSEDVNFGRFFITCVELADNWCASCEADAYVAFVSGITDTCYPSAAAAESETTVERWESIVQSLRQTAMLMDVSKVVVAVRKHNHVEYSKSK